MNKPRHNDKENSRQPRENVRLDREKAKEYLSESQWQNRFGSGRERNGSDGSSERANRFNH